MIIGLAASLVTSVAGFLFPILASFKALKANDISQLTPWLMYWSVMGCLLFVEHWSYLILQWYLLARCDWHTNGLGFRYIGKSR
jgi:hypothetical protein